MSRHLLFASLASCLTLCCIRLSVAARQPNFVIILTDDQDSLMNSTHPYYMPKLHELMALQGLELRNFLVSMACLFTVPNIRCCPSRVSLLTGKLVHNSNITSSEAPRGGAKKFMADGLDTDYLPTWLQSLGYSTYLAGKFLNDFDAELGKRRCPKGWTVFNPLLGHYNNWYMFPTFQRDCGEQRNYTNQYQTDVIKQMALEYLDDAAARGKPFFLELSPTAPHDQGFGKVAVPAPRHADLYPGLEVPQSLNWGVGLPAAMGLSTAQNLTASSIKYRYRVQSLRAVDEMLDAVVTKLKDLGELDNTYIIYTSDNGFHLGQHGLTYEKFTPYELDVRVPFFMRGPGVPAGVISDYQAMMIDLPATIVTLAGGALPAACDGLPLPLEALAQGLLPTNCSSYETRQMTCTTPSGGSIDSPISPPSSIPLAPSLSPPSKSPPPPVLLQSPETPRVAVPPAGASFSNFPSPNPPPLPLSAPSVPSAPPLMVSSPSPGPVPSPVVVPKPYPPLSRPPAPTTDSGKPPQFPLSPKQPRSPPKPRSPHAYKPPPKKVRRPHRKKPRPCKLHAQRGLLAANDSHVLHPVQDWEVQQLTESFLVGQPGQSLQLIDAPDPTDASIWSGMTAPVDSPDWRIGGTYEHHVQRMQQLLRQDRSLNSTHFGRNADGRIAFLPHSNRSGESMPARARRMTATEGYVRDALIIEGWLDVTIPQYYRKNYRVLRVCTEYSAFRPSYGFGRNGEFTCYKYSLWCIPPNKYNGAKDQLFGELFDLGKDPDEIRSQYKVVTTNPSYFPFRNRLDALLTVLSYCQGATCRQPYALLHPDGSVTSFAQAMAPAFDAQYAAYTKFSYRSACTLIYDPSNEEKDPALLTFPEAEGHQ